MQQAFHLVFRMLPCHPECMKHFLDVAVFLALATGILLAAGCGPV